MKRERLGVQGRWKINETAREKGPEREIERPSKGRRRAEQATANTRGQTKRRALCTNAIRQNRRRKYINEHMGGRAGGNRRYMSKKFLYSTATASVTSSVEASCVVL